ncbi:MAG: Rne/Rng family ribonuclease [Halanaerobium sp.]|nr:Rne/Rng family ribonuclease [Halanaerobium sp.]
MAKKIIINQREGETRVALVIDDRLEEVSIEEEDTPRIVGNVYKGIVRDVLPGMQAAFVDVGLEKNVFLHVSDVLSSSERREKGGQQEINELLQPGMKIMLQIVKEPLGSKGARGTCSITLPGRYLVLLPDEDHIGISRRIESSDERSRLKKIAEEIKPDKMGLIVRTVAEGKSVNELEDDVNYLRRLWHKIKSKNGQVSGPDLLHQELNLAQRMVRDRLTRDVDVVVVDTKEGYNELLEQVDLMAPNLKHKVSLYEKQRPIFDFYDVEKELNKAMQKKVWLKSGGYIIIDFTEALTVIDVNTGKYVGKTDLRDTVLRTNREAAQEIAHQLRLRDIGGIIIIDFIDMKDKEDREEVIRAFEEELKKDKTKYAIMGITQLGLLELTRKKVKEGLHETLQRVCPYCGGKGRVFSEATIARSAERKIKNLASLKDFQAILVEVNPRVAARLIGPRGSNLEALERELGIDIYIRGDDEKHLEEVEVVETGPKDILRKMALPVKEGEILRLKIEEQHANNSEDAIARKDGYIINIPRAGSLIGEEALVKISQVQKTYAEGQLIKTLS